MDHSHDITKILDGKTEVYQLIQNQGKSEQ